MCSRCWSGWKNVNDALEELNAIGCWDYRIQGFDGWKLSIIGGSTLTYANSHVVTAEFSGVTYIQCPTYFSHALFRLATETEERLIAPLVPIESGDTVIVIEAETMARLEPQRYYLVAQSLKIIRRNPAAS
jgi:hypothetical protein